MSYLYEAAPSDAYIQNDPNNIRPSVFNETKKNKYRNCYKSKWANLKFFLQDKTSLEASVNLLKTKTVEQFSTKCKEIYTKKIEIQLSSERNRKLLWQGTIAEGYEDIISQIEVTEGTSKKLYNLTGKQIFDDNRDNVAALFGADAEITDVVINGDK